MATFTRKCRRCDGAGTVEIPGGRVEACFGCATSEGPAGYRVVRTGADKVAHENTCRIVTATIPLIRQAEADEDRATAAREGLYELAAREPHRLVKLEASVRAGRMGDVVTALVAYHQG